MTWNAKKQKLGHDLRDAQLITAAADYGGAGVSPRRGRHDPSEGRTSAKREPADQQAPKHPSRGGG